MKIRSVEASWLRAPLPMEKQHRSDFGHITAFDAVLVTVRTDEGLAGYGEAKPAVGSSGDGAALVAIVRNELAPLLVGQDASRISALGQSMLNGTRAPLALRSGRAMPILGRRGVHQAAIAAVDLALWDLAGKARGCSVLELVGGACRPSIPAYASGGWRDEREIGAELVRYVEQGFRAVKMRIGAMDGGTRTSLARVRAARAALGPGIALMVDAHGTMGVAEARRFCAAAAEHELRFVEEPVCSDDRAGLAELRRTATLPIAAGESETSCFDFAELVERRALDVLQPDLAIAGGFSEGLRIAALAWASRLELVPHCWGSVISFQAARTLALASPAGTYVEVPMGGAPLLRELAAIDLALHDGALLPPAGPGWGVEPDPDYVARHTQE
ncbi:MAG: mandelate racemase/muconate lactonizing enzyme family protein [Planctomycetes bacterium]|nr:mandelate racemase/muconate lactonizing enzyme family protein [Planctomycetota bacterium]